MTYRAASTLILLTVCAAASAAAETRTAVMPLNAKRVPEATVDILDDLLVNEVAAKSGSTVIGSQDINAILGLDKMKEALGCDDLACAVQIGGALGVDFLLTGSVSTLGDEVIVSLTLIDTRESIAKKRAQSRAEDDERFYAYAVAAAVAELYGLPAPPAPFTASAATPPPRPSGAGLWLRSERDGVKVSLRTANGETMSCAEPVTAAKPCYLANLPPGLTTVLFSAGDDSYTYDVALSDGELARRLQFSETRWLVPIIAGAVADVAGGIAMAVALSMDEVELDPVTNEPRWGTTKAVIFSAGLTAAVLGSVAVIVGLARGPYIVEELFGPAGHLGGAPRPANLGLSLVPFADGAAALATWRF